MARQPLSPERMKARIAKAKATREAKKNAALEVLGLSDTRKKIRKTRVMTDAQKTAAITRLAKAREAKGPSTNTMIDESVRNLPDENKLSLAKVRVWIKENKELLSSIRSFQDSKDSKEREQYMRTQTYIANLESYLRNGVYLDTYYGNQMQNTIQYRVLYMAYTKDGKPKRTVGYHYPDIGLYTQEDADNNV